MERCWIVVAHRMGCRIFSRESQTAPLVLIAEHANPLGNLKDSEINSDKAGASTDNRMRARQSYSSEEPAKIRKLRDFYRGIIAELEHAYNTQRFDTMILIAEPRLLGILRALMSEQLRRTIRDEIRKDLWIETAAQIAGRLP